MHELSIAQNIVDIVQQHVPAGERDSVTSIKLRIGELAGVVPDSLDFCFRAIVAETPLQRARLDIERVPFTLHCPRCDRSYTAECGIVICPECGEMNTTTVAGTEMQVMEIEVGANGEA